MKVHPTGRRPSHCFWCPGCDSAHCIDDALWGFNGDLDRPTFSPSVLVHSHKTFVDGDLPWERLTDPSNIMETPQCHSFVTDGRIQFLADSTHALAGQTVDIPDWPIGRE